MISSAAVKIEAEAGKNYKIWVNGARQPDYATIQGVMIGAVIVWLFLFLIFGPEADGSHFERAKVAFQAGGGAAVQTDYVHHHHNTHRGHRHEKNATDLSDMIRIV
jgi:SHS family lactate transporter-like MFS transporter